MESRKKCQCETVFIVSIYFHTHIHTENEKKIFELKIEENIQIKKWNFFFHLKTQQEGEDYSFEEITENDILEMESHNVSFSNMSKCGIIIKMTLKLYFYSV